MAKVTTRLHRRFLGPLWPEDLPVDGGVFNTVALSASARRALTHQLTAPGIWRSGPLFGSVKDDVLHIHAITPGSYRIWNNPLLEGNLTYHLGVIDALQTYVMPNIDWVGTWLVRPDNLLATCTEAELWLRRGAASGIFDDIYPLLLVGLQDGRLEMEAHVLIEGVVTTITINN